MIAVVILAVVVLAYPVYAAVRFALLPSAAKRNYPAALWARFRWRWLCANLSLSYLDKHKKASHPVPFGTSAPVNPKASQPVVVKLRFPRARIRADVFGLVAKVKTIPGVGRAEFEANAVHIANAWGCHRAQVHQDRPGRVTIRGLRTDPLLVPFPVEDAPAEVYGSTSAQPVLRLYAGRDEWGTDRWITLPGMTGITIGGLPGYGKTSLSNSWLCQLAPSPAVQFVFIDGKGGGDYSPWADRAWIYTGDELPAAAAALEDVHALMRTRLRLAEQTGERNWWRTGPTEARPLIVTVIDECHTFFDLDAVKSDREAEAQVRACRSLTGQLVRKGRSVMFLTILITQKQTGDAIPTAIRDNCRVGVSFATRTKEASVAALGEHIRQYASYDPVTLQDPAYTGVCTASLRTGHDPFVRLRVPEITEEAAEERARQSQDAYRDPSAPVPTAPLVAVS